MVSYTANVVSVLVGLIAFGVSLYFYNKARDAEVRVTELLSQISNETQAMQNITRTYTARLLKTVSDIAEKRSAEELKLNMEPVNIFLRFTELFQSKSQISQVTAGSSNLISGHKIPRLADPLSAEVLQQEVITIVSILYIYVGCANYYAQWALPSQDRFDPSNSFHTHTANFLNESAAAFANCHNLLLEIQKALPIPTEANVQFRSLREADAAIKDRVRTAGQTFAYIASLASKD